MMKTKEQILDKHYKPKMHWKSVNRDSVLAAMEEYAKQEVEKVLIANNILFGEDLKIFLHNMEDPDRVSNEERVRIIKNYRAFMEKANF